MICDQVQQLLLPDGSDPLLIDASRCVTVRDENTLLHALLLLSNSGFGQIPVLNHDQMLMGIISTPMIINAIKDNVHYNWDDLDTKKITEALSTNVGKVTEPIELEDVLHEMVDHNFVCVVDSSGRFRGMITRKEILTRVNFMAHEMTHYYELEEKKVSFRR